MQEAETTAHILYRAEDWKSLHRLWNCREYKEKQLNREGREVEWSLVKKSTEDNAIR